MLTVSFSSIVLLVQAEFFSITASYGKSRLLLRNDHISHIAKEWLMFIKYLNRVNHTLIAWLFYSLIPYHCQAN